MQYDPRTEPHNMAHNPVTSLVIPRPIGWISSMGPTGIINLAPYSFFNIVASDPPFVVFSSSTRKHSQANVETAGEFVLNMATYDLRNEMNLTSGTYDDTVSEPDVAKLETVSSRYVKPPRVARAPIALECNYLKTVELLGSTGRRSTSTLIVGEVINIYIDDSVIVDGQIDVSKIRPIARLGYMDYTVVDTIFTMHRPKVDAGKKG
jgi:flavin reductase (DIM6/NTAB) family NADH-FMN oxidoreductase RutF